MNSQINQSGLPCWSLVISTYERHDILAQCIAAAVTQSAPPQEVIVVDASPAWLTAREKIPKIVEALNSSVRCIYVQAEHRSLPSQRNQGIRIATSEILFLIDDDSIMYPECAKEILNVYAADSERSVIGVGAVSVNEPPESANGESGRAEPTRESLWHRVRRYIAGLYDRGERVFLPYDGDWPTRLIPPTLAHLNIIGAKTINGFRMTFRRECIAEVGFSEILQAYAVVEDLDASYRASLRGGLVTALDARIFHASTPGGRIGRRAVAALWVTNVAVLQSLHGANVDDLRRRWKVIVTRFLFLEFLRDLLRGRWSFPTFLGIRYGCKQLDSIYRMPKDELTKWYPKFQQQLISNLQR